MLPTLPGVVSRIRSWLFKIVDNCFKNKLNSRAPRPD